MIGSSDTLGASCRIGREAFESLRVNTVAGLSGVEVRRRLVGFCFDGVSGAGVTITSFIVFLFAFAVVGRLRHSILPMLRDLYEA